MLPPIPDRPHPAAVIPPPQILAGERIVLRPYALADIGPQYEAVRESQAQVGRWLAWCHPEYSLADSRAWVDLRSAAWQVGHDFGFVIADKADGRFLGGCGLNQFEWPSRRANLGYWVRTSAAGRGVATAAARLLARFGLEWASLERIEIVAAAGNVASQRVAAKAGATLECLARRRLHVGDVQSDGFVFSLVRDDFGLPPCDDSAGRAREQ